MFIRSKMNYGAVMYDSAAQSYLSKLNTIHHSALRLILGAFRTSPSISLLYEASEWPLHLQKKFLRAQMLVHIKENKQIPYNYSNQEFTTDWSENSNFNLMSLFNPDLEILPHPEKFVPWKKTSSPSTLP